MNSEHQQPDEELSLTGPAPAAAPSSAPAEAADNAEPHIAARVGKLDVSRPGMSNEELLGAILQASPDQLIPWENCTLPSDGQFYGWPNGVVQVRPMTIADEKVLANSRLAQSGQSMDYLFRECCRFPAGFDPADLLLGDRTYLLFYVRGITHGNLYEFALDCINPDCAATSTYTYDLNLLARTMTRIQVQGQEPFRVDLPYLSAATGRDVWVTVRFLRSRDANSMMATQRARKAATAGVRPGGNPLERKIQQSNTMVELDDTITKNLEQVIVSVMGSTNPFQIRQFIQRLHAQDTAAIREWLRVNTPGIDSTIQVTCPKCDREMTVELPITDSFFRPKAAVRV